MTSWDDVASWDGAARLIESAVARYGQLDVLVNNAGILRDRMLVNMTEDDWDGVIRTHLRGVLAPTRHAAAYWRGRSKAGQPNDARVICTSSPSGPYGNPGQVNYGAAKAGIAAFALIAATELGRYGVTVNAIAPGARTRMTEGLPVLDGAVPDGAAGGAGDLAPERVSPDRLVPGRQAQVRGHAGGWRVPGPPWTARWRRPRRAGRAIPGSPRWSAGLQCSAAYTHITAEAIQVLGGTGFTWEHPAHLYFRRAGPPRSCSAPKPTLRAALADRLGL